MAIHNIERCRDGCRTSLLIAGVVFVPAIFYTSLHHWPIVFIPLERKKDNTFESQGGIQLRIQHYA